MLDSNCSWKQRDTYFILIKDNYVNMMPNWMSKNEQNNVDKMYNKGKTNQHCQHQQI